MQTRRKASKLVALDPEQPVAVPAGEDNAAEATGGSPNRVPAADVDCDPHGAQPTEVVSLEMEKGMITPVLKLEERPWEGNHDFEEDVSNRSPGAAGARGPGCDPGTHGDPGTIFGAAGARPD
jgi:hypothetical protein